MSARTGRVRSNATSSGPRTKPPRGNVRRGNASSANPASTRSSAEGSACPRIKCSAAGLSCGSRNSRMRLLRIREQLGTGMVVNTDSWASVSAIEDVSRARSVRLAAAVTLAFEVDEPAALPKSGARSYEPFSTACSCAWSPHRADRTSHPTFGLSETGRIPPSSRRWGRYTVEGPTLESGRRQKRSTTSGPMATYSSRDTINVAIELKHRYPYDDPQRYRWPARPPSATSPRMLRSPSTSRSKCGVSTIRSGCRA